jgi:putative ABC transport system permease protein
MNIVNKLTLRQLLLNKKRTLVTIIGTIISAAMITAVATLGLSFLGLMQREVILQEGEWHLQYKNVNKEQFEAIKADKETKTAILTRDLGYSYLENSKNNNKPYLYVKEYSSAGFRNFPIELKEGRLPESSNELVISEAIASNAGVEYKIGDTLELTVGQRFTKEDIEDKLPMEQNYSLIWDGDEIGEYLTQDLNKSYTIVGVIKRPDWEYTWAPGYTVLSFIDEAALTKEETFHVSVVAKHINNKMFRHAEQLAENNGIDGIEFNNSLLRYYGVIKDDGLRSMLFTLCGIIMVIIMIGSVSLIYNAFAISVSERSRYLGMLSSVGATKRQKRNSVFFEGAVIGAISIPLGIIAGHIGLGITFLCINPIIKNALDAQEGFRLELYPSSILVAFLVSSLTILISTYIPARRASNVSAIDAIRQTTDVKVTRRQIKTSKLTRKIFGIEGELGLKNLKRNKGRYKATVFSLIISMVLFLMVSSFTDQLRKSIELTQDGINFDIKATIPSEDSEQEQMIIDKITALENIENATKVKTLDANTWIPEASIADYLKEYKEELLVDGKYPYYVTLNILDEASLQKYTKELGIEYQDFAKSEQPRAIVIDTIQYKDYATDKYVETKAVKTKTGNKLEISVYNEDTGEEDALQSIEIAALTDKMPTGIMSSGKNAGFHLILSEDAFQKLMKGKEGLVSKRTQTLVYFDSGNPLRLQEDMEKIQNSVGASNLYINNVYLYRQREEQMLLLMSVFTYAFIILITAICVANIINTISTSIALRKREFAMLKSIGITPKGFNRMLNYESIFYGLKSLLYGLPISFLVICLLYRVLANSFEYALTIPVHSLIIVVVAVFIIVGTAMLYSSNKVKKENIIDALKQEII